MTPFLHLNPFFQCTSGSTRRSYTCYSTYWSRQFFFPLHMDYCKRLGPFPFCIAYEITWTWHLSWLLTFIFLFLLRCKFFSLLLHTHGISICVKGFPLLISWLQMISVREISKWHSFFNFLLNITTTYILHGASHYWKHSFQLFLIVQLNSDLDFSLSGWWIMQRKLSRLRLAIYPAEYHGKGLADSAAGGAKTKADKAAFYGTSIKTA